MTRSGLYPLVLPSALAAAALLALAACSADKAATGPSAAGFRPSFAVGDQVPIGSVVGEVGRFKVCKTGNSGTFSVTLNQNSQANPAGTTTSATYTIAAGQCVTVAEDFNATGLGFGTAVTVTETSPGCQSVSGTIFLSPAGTNPPTSSSPVVNPTCPTVNTLNTANFPSASGLRINAFHGVVVTFNNAPPAPPSGCTPGYFKNHLVPGRTATFASFGITNTGHPASFTLLDALNNPGGGPTVQDAKDLLLFQLAAALLNSQLSPGFPFTTAQLVAAANAALASNDRGTILALKDQLDAANNLGCRLSFPQD